MKTVDFTIAIDESGQLVTSGNAAKHNKYFTLGAIIYPTSEEKKIENLILSCKQKIKYEKEILHFNEIKSHYKKIIVCRTIGTSKDKFYLFGVVSNKDTLGKYKEYIGKDYTFYYNKCLMYIFERIGYFLYRLKYTRGYNINTIIYIENININFYKTKKYLNKCKENPIRQQTKLLKYFDFSNMHMVGKKDFKTLQIADVMASALFSCLEITHIQKPGEPRYIYELRNKIY